MGKHSAHQKELRDTHSESMQDSSLHVDNLPQFLSQQGEQLLYIPDVADMLDIPQSKVRDYISNHQLIAVEEDGIRKLPSKYFTDEAHINKFVPGVTSLLSDGGFSDAEIIEYLYTEDDSLPGQPIDALRGHRAREVMRRAQAMAF